MTLLLLCFLLGCVTGLRSLTPPATVCWAAHLGWLHFAGTKLAFLGRLVTLIVFTLLALIELIADKLPNTPRSSMLPSESRIPGFFLVRLSVAYNFHAAFFRCCDFDRALATARSRSCTDRSQ